MTQDQLGSLSLADSDPPKRINTVERAMDVLKLFTKIDSRTLGITEIAHSLGLSKAVVHRLVTTLAGQGFLEPDPASRRYALGPAVLMLGLSYLDRIDLRSLARDVMRELSENVSETATLSIRTGSTRVYIDQVTPAREVRMSVQLGKPFPLHAGSSSKAFLAFLPEGEREEYLATELERLTDATITDPDRLRRELTAVRQREYAFSLGERQPGAASVAAPVFDHNGSPVAVLSVCGPIERFAPRMGEAAAQLLEATSVVSRRLGYAGG